MDPATPRLGRDFTWARIEGERTCPSQRQSSLALFGVHSSAANGASLQAVGLGGSFVVLRSNRVLVVFFVAILVGTGSGAGEGSAIASTPVAVKSIRKIVGSFISLIVG